MHPAMLVLLFFAPSGCTWIPPSEIRGPPSDEGCGNQAVTAPEECDRGAANSDNGSCTSTCTSAVCGDGHVWADHEECDDGNTSGGDGCGKDCGNPRVVSLAEADAELLGPAAGDEVGNEVVAAGDFDHDGFDDVLVGSVRHMVSPDRCIGAYLVRGPFEGTLDLTFADVTFSVENPNVYSGYCYGGEIAGGGDANGDGFDDVWVDGYLFHGPLSGLVDSDDAVASLSGYWSTFVGDVACDAGDDILTSGIALYHASLLCGPFSGVIDPEVSAVATFEGLGLGSTAHDVDGDGVGDVIFGDSESDLGGPYSGAAYVFLGPASGTYEAATADAKLAGSYPGDAAGYRCSAAGDVNADGYGDLLIDARLSNLGGVGTGTVYLVLGPRSGTQSLASADAMFFGEPGESDGFTYVRDVAEAGDVDGDGFAEVLFDAPWNDNANGTDAGAAYLFYGPSGGSHLALDADVKLLGLFGGESNWELGTAGDIDGDGRSDLLIGNADNDHNGLYAGGAFVVLGGGRILGP